MRARGTGSIVLHQGKHWARLWIDGKLTSLGLHDTREVADAVLNQALIERASRPAMSAGVLTFATFGKRVLDMREDEGVRSVSSERRRFKRHLETCAFADKAVADVTPGDVDLVLKSIAKKQAADNRGKRKVSRKTVQRCFALISAIFSVAVVREMRPANPCAGIKLRKDKEQDVDEDGDMVWDWLRGEEQYAVLTCEQIPIWFRVMMRAAWGIGWRQGEQWNHELRDVHFERNGKCACGEVRCITLKEKGPGVFIRWGSKGKPPKSGRRRYVTLFGEGLTAMREWLDLLPKYAPKNPLRLTFPTKTGCRRQPGAPERSVRIKQNDGTSKVGKVELLDEAMKAAGVSRHIRWHDLRHTCASSLVSGTWGHKWSLKQVCEMLGHSSITVTEKYAHLDKNSMREETEATSGHGVIRSVTGGGFGGSGVAAIRNEINEVGRTGLEPVTYGLKEPGVPEVKRGFTSENNISVTREAQERAAKLLKLVAEGRGREALALAVAAAAEVVDPLDDRAVSTQAAS